MIVVTSAALVNGDLLVASSRHLVLSQIIRMASTGPQALAIDRPRHGNGWRFPGATMLPLGKNLDRFGGMMAVVPTAVMMLQSRAPGCLDWMCKLMLLTFFIFDD